ncbi:MAG TPA: sugar ABC transporter substrate-binding protein [Firmicutes bacterium]|nr:sugar ABC transporter substrate-binding protein [Bacillota bacterium]
MKKAMKICLAMCLVLVFVALGVAQAAEKPFEIVIILKNLVNPVWIDMKKGAEDAAARYGAKLTALAPLKADNNEEQVRAIEDSIIRKVDAIVLIPSDSKGIIPGIEKANKAGIPVINVNTKAHGGKCETFVAVENYDAAFKVADAMAKKLGGQGKVIILEGVPGAQSTMDLNAGTVDALKKYPGIKVVASQTAKFQRAEAMRVMENLLQRYPDIDAVLAANDEMALGAVEAIDAAGKTGKILVSGLDANADAVKAIAEGKLTMSCDKRSYQQGYVGVEMAVKFLRGEKIPERVVIETTLVDKSNVDQYLKK